MSPFFYCVLKSKTPVKLQKFNRGFAFVLFVVIL